MKNLIVRIGDNCIVNMMRSCFDMYRTVSFYRALQTPVLCLVCLRFVVERRNAYVSSNETITPPFTVSFSLNQNFMIHRLHCFLLNMLLSNIINIFRKVQFDVVFFSIRRINFFLSLQLFVTYYVNVITEFICIYCRNILILSRRVTSKIRSSLILLIFDNYVCKL